MASPSLHSSEVFAQSDPQKILLRQPGCSISNELQLRYTFKLKKDINPWLFMAVGVKPCIPEVGEMSL